MIILIITTLFTLQITTQQDFVNKTELFIETILQNYRIIETDAMINEFASIGASWSKRIDIKSKDLFLNKYEQKDYQEYTFTFLYFSDEESCLKARRNYIDNYGGRGGKLTPETKGIKRPPSFNLITENSIIIFEVSCVGQQMGDKWSWDKLKPYLTSTFGSHKSETIENGCGWPIIWNNKK
jgi:hypothetical protein